MNYEVTIGETTRTVSVRAADGGWWVSVDGRPALHYRGEKVGIAEWILTEGGQSRGVGVHVRDDRALVQVDGQEISARIVDPRKAALDLAGGAELGAVSTQMPGAVVRVLVDEGQTVSQGDVLLVVEAMKMENEFKAPIDGTVQTVHVEAGQAVDSGTLLVSIAPDEE